VKRGPWGKLALPPLTIRGDIAGVAHLHKRILTGAMQMWFWTDGLSNQDEGQVLNPFYQDWSDSAL
jgi:hypothetical protein